jgi:ATP-dependent helicase/nuclease subunit A
LRKDPEALRAWLMRCAGASHLWFGTGAWQPPMRPRVLSLLGLPSDADEKNVAALCEPTHFEDAALRICLEGYRGWKSKSADVAVPAIESWLGLGAELRLEQIDILSDALFYKNGNPKLPKSASDEFAGASARIGRAIAQIIEFRTLLDLSDFIAPALELGQAFALNWEEAKLREGLLDFDDLIRRAAELLKRKEMADWIRYKLDRRFDHILVDEAQDTNAEQWQIIDALIDDFFSGEGAHGAKLRTIFTVGDYKQAIFGFQGTSPDNFQRAKERVRAAISALAENAPSIRRTVSTRELLDLDLGRSFRTAQNVLNFVDRAIETVGWQALGLEQEPASHLGHERPGLVTLWNPVTESETDDDEAGEEDWLAKHDRRLADKIAEQVQRWMSSEPFVLAKDGKPRNARPGDVMVLVRKRKELAALIVARLHARGVPVAGVDRLRLGAPLAVKDLMSALRFGAQPLDDLNLANLLSSPLIGWSQDDLLAYVPRAKGVRLWHHLRKSEEPLVARTVEKLREILAVADFLTPQALLQWILVGPWRAREKLVARLGREANDPIDELVNAAFSYEAGATPSLASFIQWFDTGEGVLKRDPGEAPDQVRVMTVHGSKGLEAPIVILADATGRPGSGGDIALDEVIPGQDAARSVPIPGLKKEERVGPLEAAQQAAQQAELQEHWRLLYVAMTRAEEALFIGGSLGSREKEPHEDSWYARLAPIFGAEALEDDIWGARYELGERAGPARPVGQLGSPAATALPHWAKDPVGEEPRPPRPLAPSAAGEDQGAGPPMPPDQATEAARRGVLIHRLLERLPEVEPERRAEAAANWLSRQAKDLDPGSRAEIAERAIATIDNPDFAEVFGPNALAEIPLAANVEGIVVAGTADRLLVETGKVTVVDFKTAKRPPSDLAEIPLSTLRQMGAYASALQVIYPDHEIRAAVLYTQNLELIEIPANILAENNPRLHPSQESYPREVVE